jgi:hypothetical protein
MTRPESSSLARRSDAARRRSKPWHCGHFVRAMLVLALMPHPVLPAQAADVGPGSAATMTPPPASDAGARAHRAQRSGLANRVQLMTKELDLDVRQQTELKTILEAQRSEVSRVWSDPSVPSAVRVGATQAIGERTADRIRAMLSDAQRKKYIQPRQHEAPVGAPGGDVQTWMSATQGQESPATASAAATAREN